MDEPQDMDAFADVPRHALTAPVTHSDSDGGSADYEADAPGGWRFESQRWMATLNPGRTQREYEKAISYFFATPGVPQEIAALTFDLLLAYRGALALRATAHAETPPRRSTRSAPRGMLASAPPAQLEGHRPADAAEGGFSDGSTPQHRPTPLSPATVNIRLTALRQFLVYCSLYGAATTLTPDQLRAALRRLSVERRRPYQTLAEPEWAAFLAAALLPAERQPGPTAASAGERADALRPQGPWGVPRAAREEARGLLRQTEDNTQARLEGTDEEEEAVEQAPGTPIRSKAGLTGQRTAPRDHALLALALATGLRAIELASLDVGDLSREWRAGQEEWWLVLPDSKTKGQSGGRTLPLAPELVQILRDYLAVTGRHWERPEHRETPLFLSGSPKSVRTAGGRATRERPGVAADAQDTPPAHRLSPSQIRLIVDRVETQWQALYGGAGGKRGGRSGDARRISPHALRHSTAIALLEGNQASGRPPASVEHVRGWLGHLDIRTTQGYLSHLDARRHRRPFTLSLGSEGLEDSSQSRTQSDDVDA